MSAFSHCPNCGGSLDTGFNCTRCPWQRYGMSGRMRPTDNADPVKQLCDLIDGSGAKLTFDRRNDCTLSPEKAREYAVEVLREKGYHSLADSLAPRAPEVVASPGRWPHKLPPTQDELREAIHNDTWMFAAYSIGKQEGARIEREDRAAASPIPSDTPTLDTLIDGPGGWTARQALRVLADAATHLLKDHDCDGHGYEHVMAARDAAMKAVIGDQRSGRVHNAGGSDG